MHIVVGRIMINHRVLGGTSWQDKFIIVLFHHIFSYHLADCRGGMWGGMRREMGCPPKSFGGWCHVFLTHVSPARTTLDQSQTTIGTVELRKLQNRRLGLLSAAKCAKTLWCGAGPKIPKTRPRKIRKGPIWCTKMERSPHSLGLFGWENLEKFIGPLTKMISPPTRQVLGL